MWLKARVLTAEAVETRELYVRARHVEPEQGRLTGAKLRKTHHSLLIRCLFWRKNENLGGRHLTLCRRTLFRPGSREALGGRWCSDGGVMLQGFLRCTCGRGGACR